MSAPDHERSVIDLSGSRWREARIRTATTKPVAAFGLRPSSGQLFGSGKDRLHVAFHDSEFAVPADMPAPVIIGERGTLMALLSWAQRCGVKTSAAYDALSQSKPTCLVPLRAFHQVFVDIQHECAVSGKTAWGLLSSNRADGPVRVLMPTDPATILLATPTAAVGISSDGLHLLKRHISLTGWLRTETGLLLTTPDGPRRLGSATLSAQLLDLLGRNAPQIDLCRVSLSALLAQTVTSLAHLATAAVGTIGDQTSENVMVSVEHAGS